MPLAPSQKKPDLEHLIDYFRQYIMADDREFVVVSLWVLASWINQCWDKFPHIAITSPHKRCGKTTLLELIGMVVEDPLMFSNGTAPVVFRSIAQRKRTILLDEAQSLDREGSQTFQELFCASIQRGAMVPRCVGSNYSVQEFPTYAPKVISKIGELEGTLADRCLPVRLSRLVDSKIKKKFRSREAEPIATDIKQSIITWAKDPSVIKEAETRYLQIKSFDLANSRLAELLDPLMVVLEMLNNNQQTSITGKPANLEGGSTVWATLLHSWAHEIDSHGEEEWDEGVRLLNDIRDVFIARPNKDWIAGVEVKSEVLQLDHWKHYDHGRPISDKKFAAILRPYDIESEHFSNLKQTKCRGYYKVRFEKAWQTYLPALPTPQNAGFAGLPVLPVVSNSNGYHLSPNTKSRISN